ncbi:MAG: hypothetical protein K6A30_02725 [Lachnospiraceae bacterium]|nr:hypothetical protein [Lachnospiraceae bacterium]
MKRNYLIVACFFLIVAAGCVSYMITPDKKFSPDENRYLTERPKCTAKALLSGEYTEKMDSYATDQFALRTKAITLKTQVSKLAGVKDGNGVYFGKDDTLMLKKTPQEFSQQKYENNLFAVSAFAKRNEKIPFYVMLAPTASYIWKDKLPSKAVDYDQREKLDQAAAYFKDDENITLVDPSQELLQHKGEDLYYRTDHHWTEKGAYYAYRSLQEAMGRKPKEYKADKVTDSFYGTLYSKVLPFGMKPDTIEAYRPGSKVEVSHSNGKKVTDSIFDEDKLKVKDKYQYFLGGNDDEVTIKTGNKNGQHLLIVKDSYANSFLPFLVDDYETIHMVDLRYFNGNMTMYMKTKKINKVLVLYNLNNFDEDTSIVKVQMP